MKRPNSVALSGIIIMKKSLLLCALSFAALTTPAYAIVGLSSSGAISNGGDSRYLAQGQAYSGVVGLLINWGNDSYSSCSGTLLSDRRSILTAGHCTADDGGKSVPVSTTVYFDNGSSPDANIFEDAIAGNVQIAVSNTTTHPDYTTSVLDQNDIAVLTLAELAPDWATSYELYESSALQGLTHNSVGYGLRGFTDAEGEFEDVGSRRQGTNRYDFRTGEDAFGDRYTRGSEYREELYVADFDDGTEDADFSCGSASHWGNDETGKYCDRGSATEVVNMGGDSGGPQLINGQIASITSAGDPGNNGTGTPGAVSYLVPIYPHVDFIRGAMISAVPEPATWLQLLLGFTMLGGMLRTPRLRAVVPSS